MAASAMVVDRDNRVVWAFGHRPNDVSHSFLHFGVGPLDGVEFYGIAELTRVNRGNCTATHSDPIIVPAHNDHLIALGRRIFQAVLAAGEAHTASLHNDLVKAVLFSTFLVLKSQYTTTDQGLAKLVSKIAGSIRGFDQDVHGGLIKPFPFFQVFFPESSL